MMKVLYKSTFRFALRYNVLVIYYKIIWNDETGYLSRFVAFDFTKEYRNLNSRNVLCNITGLSFRQTYLYEGWLTLEIDLLKR